LSSRGFSLKLRCEVQQRRDKLCGLFITASGEFDPAHSERATFDWHLLDGVTSHDTSVVLLFDQ
jgi:hypothetical protein